MDDSLSERMKRIDSLLAGPGKPVSSDEAMESASIAALRALVEDRTAPTARRRAALVSLSERLRGEADFSEIVLARIDDPEEGLAREAIGLAPPFDGRVIGRLRRLLDDPRPGIWSAAASALSRKKDREILARMLTWARNGDALHRRAGLAAVAFLLIPEEHLAVVEAICEDGPRDAEDEAVLVEALRVAEARVVFWRRQNGGSSRESLGLP